MVFVGVLGASNHTFVDVTWSRSLPDWTMSHVWMFEFWGGVPADSDAFRPFIPTHAVH